MKSDTGPDGIMFLLIGFRTVEDGYCSVKSDIDQGTYILSIMSWIQEGQENILLYQIGCRAGRMLPRKFGYRVERKLLRQI